MNNKTPMTLLLAAALVSLAACSEKPAEAPAAAPAADAAAPAAAPADAAAPAAAPAGDGKTGAQGDGNKL
ncbi:MAG: hypothetical protein RL684_257 [Pseudomonadota bacterium]|jgi:hypothetical protein